MTAMPAILSWLLALLPTNPICMRLVQGGSRRARHLYIRSGYLALMIVALLFVLLESVSAGSLNVRELASGGARMFTYVSYLQVGLICLLTPVFMAGAIAQEANPRTWDILLTTPLNTLQIVLGNLFGRLFFVLALLCSSLPLFVMTQYFGGVPGRSIIASYAIAGMNSLVVAAVAVTLSVTRTAGKRAVFVFYVAVVMYLFVTYAIDLQLRTPIGATGAVTTTLMTPLNPFLALEVLLRSNTYTPHDLTGTGAGWLTRAWLSQPISTFCWLCGGLSFVLVAYCTARMRIIGTSVGTTPWYRKMLGLGAKASSERPPRPVGRNPIAWREAQSRGRTVLAILGRWIFLFTGVMVAVGLLTFFHTGGLTIPQFQLAVVSIVSAEIVVIALIALNTSASAVSREREDGTLDIILTTPIQPGPYLSGKLRGLIQFLLPMILVPIITMGMIALYVLLGGFGREGGVTVTPIVSGTTVTLPPLPAVLPEAALTMPLVLGPFVAFCVMVGLHWSIRSKGTIGSVVAAVGVVIAVAGVLGTCAIPAGENFAFVGGFMSAMTPVNLLYAQVFPTDAIPKSFAAGGAASIGGGRLSVVIGAVVAAGGYVTIVTLMHTNMKASFMRTVRKLAGTS